MASYRLYWIGADGHFKLGRTIDFPSDEAAVSYAKELIGQFPAMEVWQEKRFVARIGEEPPTEAA